MKLYYRAGIFTNSLFQIVRNPKVDAKLLAVMTRGINARGRWYSTKEEKNLGNGLSCTRQTREQLLLTYNFEKSQLSPPRFDKILERSVKKGGYDLFISSMALAIPDFPFRKCCNFGTDVGHIELYFKVESPQEGTVVKERTVLLRKEYLAANGLPLNVNTLRYSILTLQGAKKGTKALRAETLLSREFVKILSAETKGLVVAMIEEEEQSIRYRAKDYEGFDGIWRLDNERL